MGVITHDIFGAATQAEPATPGSVVERDDTRASLASHVTYRERPMGHAITAESLEVVTSWLADALRGHVSRGAR